MLIMLIIIWLSSPKVCILLPFLLIFPTHVQESRKNLHSSIKDLEPEKKDILE